MHSYFVTGTDTEVGKTFVCCRLLRLAASKGLKTVAFKPVAAGAELTAEGWRNEDGVQLAGAINQTIPYEVVNPFCLPDPVAPHITAQQQGVKITTDAIAEHFRGLLQYSADFCLVEGAGGWRVPLNEWEFFSDIAKTLKLPVILVVGMRLGCINHGLLTAEAIERDGLRLAGWVANRLTPQPMTNYRENIATLTSLLAAPCLGEVPFMSGTEPVGETSFRLPDSL